MSFFEGMEWRGLSARILSECLPNHCYLCSRVSGGFLCHGCRGDLPSAQPGCRCCGLTLTRAGPEALCGDCQRNPKPFARTVSAFSYGHPADFLLNRFKHHRHFVCGEHLSEHLAAAVRRSYGGESLPDMLVPVPLHWTRIFSRGFNQSDLIAYRLAHRLKRPVSHACRRLLRNPRQQGLDREQRLRNLRCAFEVSGDVHSRRLALVDDVMTTGATVTEISRCLLAAGAARVDVWTLARVM